MTLSKINGFIYVVGYSNKFRKLIEEISRRSAEISKNINLNDIGIFLFGSPSRQEMIEESDADILIIRKENNQEYYNFREVFMRELEKENFPKIDVPDWGTLKECETYIEKSITEGNQVIEASFVYGDELVLEEVLKLKEKYCTIDKFERVICFQKLYFDQYYKQRTINGIKNVKYGHGGTRDFMFVTWLSNLFDIAEGKMINFDYNFPYIYKSLNQMYD